MDTKKVSPYTDFLYARPSILEGIGRIVDFFGVLQEYNVSSTPEAADARATRADWMAIGDDMRAVLPKRGKAFRASKNGGRVPSKKSRKQKKSGYERKLTPERA